MNFERDKNETTYYEYFHIHHGNHHADLSSRSSDSFIIINKEDISSIISYIFILNSSFWLVSVFFFIYYQNTILLY